MGYLCNVDIGGTHTDVAVIDDDGNITEAKVQSTPDDFAQGFFNSLNAIAVELGIEKEELLEESDLVSHGTTVGTNAVIEGEESEAALVTTRGAEDTLSIMRGAPGRSSGLPIEQVLRYQEATKPDPIVPKHLVYGVNERIDSMGDVVVEFNEKQASEIAAELAAADIDAVGVSFERLSGPVAVHHQFHVVVAGARRAVEQLLAHADLRDEPPADVHTVTVSRRHFSDPSASPRTGGVTASA